MDEGPKPVIAVPGDRTREGWDDPVRGTVSWVTLFSRDITPTSDLSAGIAEFVSGGVLHPHRHRQAEIYHILEGTGLLTLEGTESMVTAGPRCSSRAMRSTGSAMSEPARCGYSMCFRPRLSLTSSIDSPIRLEAHLNLDLKHLRCPLPVLRTRKALRALDPGATMVVQCTDPLAGIDIPHLLGQTGDTLIGTVCAEAVWTFTIRKAG